MANGDDNQRPDIIIQALNSDLIVPEGDGTNCFPLISLS